MRSLFFFTVMLTTHVGVASAQVSGNAAYSQTGGKARAEQAERSKRAALPTEAPPSATTMFIDAAVLMNVQADEYVAVFGVLQEASTVAECQEKMDATLKEFSEGLKSVGVPSERLVVDFVAQNKVYSYRLEGTVAKEELAGFEVKKNASIRYKDKNALDKLVAAAARAKIFDLIKVDYVVANPEPIQDKLAEEAAQIIKRKAARHERLLDIKFSSPPQVYAEKFSTYFPADLYDSYTAYEGESIDRDQYRSKYAVQGARKSRTFFFNPLTGDGFDRVIHPVVMEPVVQFTLYMKVKYEIASRAAKKDK